MAHLLKQARENSSIRQKVFDMPYSDIAYFSRRYYEVKPNNNNDDDSNNKTSIIIEKETINIPTAEGGIESIKSSEILKIALFEFKIAYSAMLTSFRTQIPYFLKVLNTRKREINQRNSVYFFDHNKQMYRDSPEFILVEPRSTLRYFNDMRKSSPDNLELNFEQIISKIINNELKSDPQTYFFLHRFGEKLNLNRAYSLLPLNDNYISLESQVSNSNIDYFQRRNIEAAISTEKESLKNKRGSYKGFFGAEGKYGIDEKQIGKTLYSIFHEGKEIAVKDLEDTLQIASILTEPFFIHQFGSKVNFNLFNKLKNQLEHYQRDIVDLNHQEQEE